jgi:hypothetical protein
MNWAVAVKQNRVPGRRKWGKLRSVSSREICFSLISYLIYIHYPWKVVPFFPQFLNCFNFYIISSGVQMDF